VRSVLPFFKWKVSVLNLLHEGTHRGDADGPVLTAYEQQAMEFHYDAGCSPEEFVNWLAPRQTMADNSIGPVISSPR
jgi:hypothetical protein